MTYGLQAASDSGLFSRIHVSTDSEEIAGIAQEAGFPVDFLRDKSLADDYTGLVPVYRWVVERYRQQNVDFDAVCTLFPVCPLIDSSDFEASYSIFREHEGRLPLYTVTPYPVPVEWAYHRQDDGRLIPCDSTKFATRSQDLDTAYYECGPISWFSPQTLQALENGANEGFVSYVLPRSRALDVDNLEDWEFLETVYRGLHSAPASGGGRALRE